MIDRLNAEITRALEQADVCAALSRYALVPAPMTPETFGAFIRAEMERNGRILRKPDLKLEQGLSRA
ncbi:MAG: hypothetical protein JWO70_4711 [Betaproteobacteria bacterium]|nr:hypothetical protein [Betaproteobacteria bacterium]